MTDNWLLKANLRSAKARAGDRDKRQQLSGGDFLELGFGRRQRRERVSQGGNGQSSEVGMKRCCPTPACPWCVCGRDGLEKFATRALPIMSSPSGL